MGETQPSPDPAGTPPTVSVQRDPYWSNVFSALPGEIRSGIHDSVEGGAMLGALAIQWAGNALGLNKEFVAEAAGFAQGFAEGVNQGVFDAINGVQDGVIGLVNLAVITSPVGFGLSYFGGINLTIPSPDWSSGLVYQEPSFQHSVSKFVGGQGLITIATAGLGTGAEAAGAGLRLGSGAGGEVAAAQFIRTIEPGESLGAIINEAKAITFETGNEVALVRLASGERALFSGGPRGIEFAEGEITRIIGHTHPYDIPATGLRQALRILTWRRYHRWVKDPPISWSMGC